MNHQDIIKRLSEKIAEKTIQIANGAKTKQLHGIQITEAATSVLTSVFAKMPKCPENNDTDVAWIATEKMGMRNMYRAIMKAFECETPEPVEEVNKPFWCDHMQAIPECDKSTFSFCPRCGDPRPSKDVKEEVPPIVTKDLLDKYLPKKEEVELPEKIDIDHVCDTDIKKVAKAINGFFDYLASSKERK